MRILLTVLGVLVLGLPARAVAPSAATTVRCESPKPAAKREDDEAKKKAEAARKKAAAALAAKQKAATQKTPKKPGATTKASAESSFGSAARRALLGNRASVKGKEKETAKTPPRAKV